MNQLSFTPEVCEDGPFKGYVKLHWIRSAAEKKREEKVRALAHHLNPQNLRRAFRELDGSRACGVDGVTKQYYVKLESGEPSGSAGLRLDEAGARSTPG